MWPRRISKDISLLGSTNIKVSDKQAEVRNYLLTRLKASQVVVISITSDAMSKATKNCLHSYGIKFTSIEIDTVHDDWVWRNILAEDFYLPVIPFVFVNGQPFSDCMDIILYARTGSLQKYLNGDFYLKDPMAGKDDFEYDLIVIGWDYSAREAAIEAASLGKKVAMFLHVNDKTCLKRFSKVEGGIRPVYSFNEGVIRTACSAAGNVYIAALDANKAFAQVMPDVEFQWEKFCETLDATTKAMLQQDFHDLPDASEIKIIPEFAKISDHHTVTGYALTEEDQETRKVTAKHILVTSNVESKLTIPGSEHCIYPDEVLYLKQPGKVAVLGNNREAIEINNFLCTTLQDSQLLMLANLQMFDEERGVDNECMKNGLAYARKILPFWKWKENVNPISIQKLDSGKLQLSYSVNGENVEEEFDTIINSLGRECYSDALLGTENLGLESTQVVSSLNVTNSSEKPQYMALRRKIIAVQETSRLPYLHFCGVNVAGRSEYPAMSKEAAVYLMRRLFTSEYRIPHYNGMCGGVYGPLELGYVGLSEKQAQNKYGEDAVIFFAYFTPLTWINDPKRKNTCECKCITNRNDSYRVVGLQMLGTDAIEGMCAFQSVCLGGFTKFDLDHTVSVHPCNTEPFMNLKYVKGRDEAEDETC